MSHLADFLLARIAEEEERGRDLIAQWFDVGNACQSCGTDGARVVAECEAKRRIVERYVKIQGSRQDGDLVERQTLRWVMELHAVAHADHPDYREEWRVAPVS